MLEVNNILVNYGAAPALWGVTLTVQPGELVCVVGPNGAGKTTLINAIAGLHRVREGSLRFNGKDITQLASHRFCEAGIAIVPEGRRLFTQMTVLDNLELGSFIPRPRRTARPRWRMCWRCFRHWRPSCKAPLAPCPAASNKWWRWAAP